MGRILVVVAIMGGQFLSEDRGASESYLAAQPATRRLLRDVLLKDCNISVSSAWGFIAAWRLHRYGLKQVVRTLLKYFWQLLLVQSRCHGATVTVSGAQSRCAFHIAVKFFPFMELRQDQHDHTSSGHIKSHPNMARRSISSSCASVVSTQNPHTCNIIIRLD